MLSRVNLQQAKWSGDKVISGSRKYVEPLDNSPIFWSMSTVVMSLLFAMEYMQ